MNDLIRRSDLIEMLTNENEREYAKEAVLQFVQAAPTAYDVDKVVKELEATRKEITKWDSGKHYIYKEGTDWMAEKAIEIVRKGGVK